MRALDALTLAAVALVVLLVSLPRLEDLAIRENEADAARLAKRLGALAGEEDRSVGAHQRNPREPQVSPAPKAHMTTSLPFMSSKKPLSWSSLIASLTGSTRSEPCG